MPWAAPQALPAVPSQLPSLTSAVLACSHLAQGAVGISGAQLTELCSLEIETCWTADAGEKNSCSACFALLVAFGVALCTMT